MIRKKTLQDLLTQSKGVDMMFSSNKHKIDLSKNDVYNLQNVPVDLIECSLKLIRSMRKLALQERDLQSDIHLRVVQKILINLAVIHNNGGVIDAPTNPLPTSDESDIE